MNGTARCRGRYLSMGGLRAELTAQLLGRYVSWCSQAAGTLLGSGYERMGMTEESSNGVG